MSETLVMGGPFETPKEGPFVLGKLYTKTWRAPGVHGVNETWAKRCREYWERVEQRFGYVFSDHRNAFDDATLTITTYATPLVMLKGERYPHRDNHALRH